MTAPRVNRRAARIAAAAVLAFACGRAQIAVIEGHELSRGVLTFPSGAPVAGQAADVQIVVFEAGEILTPLIDTSVVVTADMTGHPMAPATAELKTLLSDRKRAGEIGFSMPGLWRLTIEIVEPDEDPRVAVLPLMVLPSSAMSSPAPLALNFGLDVPARPTVFEPWTVVWTAIGLVLGLEGVAVAAYLKRRFKPGR